MFTIQATRSARGTAMHNMVMATLHSEEAAHKFSDALWQEHHKAALTVYATSILARAEDGSIDTLSHGDRGPLGTTTGMMVGSLVGLLGGPFGVLAGAAIGAASGATADHWDSELRHEIIAEVKQNLATGEFLVIADVAETSEEIVNNRLSEFGGKATRRPREEVIKAHVDHSLSESQSRLKKLAIKAERATGEAKESLQKKLHSARKQLQEASAKASQHLKAEAVERHQAIKKQIADAPDNLKEDLETAQRCAQADADRRIERLQQEFEQR